MVCERDVLVNPRSPIGLLGSLSASVGNSPPRKTVPLGFGLRISDICRMAMNGHNDDFAFTPLKSRSTRLLSLWT
jgi:hypothetical protein